MVRLLCLFTCIFVLASCTATRVSTGYYDVKGKNAKQLDKQIRRKGPLKGHAIASAELRLVPVKITPKQTASGCRITTARIRVDAKITLPRWRNRAGASRDLKRGFDGLAAYAKAHEEFHVKIAESAAKSLERKLKAIPPQRTCDILAKRSRAVVKRQLKLHDKAQKAFDAAEQKRLRRLFAQSRKQTKRSGRS